MEDSLIEINLEPIWLDLKGENEEEARIFEAFPNPPNDVDDDDNNWRPKPVCFSFYGPSHFHKLLFWLLLLLLLPVLLLLICAVGVTAAADDVANIDVLLPLSLYNFGEIFDSDFIWRAKFSNTVLITIIMPIFIFYYRHHFKIFELIFTLISFE